MASINSLTKSTSSTSSLYGNKNIISGMASGMDTEAMIENSISGYKTKIQGFINQQTKLGWKQDAYRSITDKLIALSSKYTSFTSKTNLASNSFFNKAVKTTASGDFASKVSATGKASSDVQINQVTQLASAASYRVDVGSLGFADVGSLTSGNIDWGATAVPVSDITGSLTIKVDTTAIDISFGAEDKVSNATELVNKINEKLSQAEVGGSTGDQYVKAVLGSDGTTVTFEAQEVSRGGKASDGAGVYFSSASGDLKDTLGIETSSSLTSGHNSFTVTGDTRLSHDVSMAESLSGKTFKVTLDGSTKTITLGQYGSDLTGSALKDAVMRDLQDGLSRNFGSKVSVESVNESGSTGQLKFSTSSPNSTLMVGTDAGATLGMQSDLTSYMNTGKTLKDLLGDDMGGLTANAEGKYDLVINGTTVGSFEKSATLATVLDAINNSDAGVKVSYSQMTNKLNFTANETGAEGRIDFGSGGLAQRLFRGADGSAGEMTDGKDAKLNVTVNGENLELTRSSNVVNLDGLSVTLKGTFNEDVTDPSTISGDKAVRFNTSSDADAIVDAVKSFVEQINEVMKDVHSAYSTAPLKTTGYSNYEPLSDDDKSGMSESEIKAYEEKAKQGLLYADRDVNGLYSALRTAITGSGMDAGILRDIGLTTSYSGGVTTLNLDEDKLREALANDPDKVRDIFTKSKENGASSDGLMASVSKVLDKYASTSIGNYGILVKKAGTKTKSLTLTDNALQKQIDSFDKQIEQWKTKMSSKIDYYTRQFTALEQLINTMNSQSSALAGLMGGGGGY